MSTISLYACGGAAINVAKTITFPPVSQPEPGFAGITPHFIDTSKSNLRGLAHDSVYLIQEDLDRNKVDGSGKVRSTNYEPVKAALPEIMFNHKPGDVNIVLHSASGGSGSVIGPLVSQELLRQDRTVFVIMIGSTTCEREVKNTIDTIMTYEKIAKGANKPVIAFYHENGNGVTFAENDGRVRIEILLAAILWSGQNHGLDSKDLDNFINYHRASTHFPIGLTGLRVFTKTEPLELERGQVASSVLTLVRDGEDPEPGVATAYHSYGTVSPEAEGSLRTETPLHLATIQGCFNPIVHRLQDKMTQLHEQFNGVPVGGLSMKGVEANGDNFVL